jgi:hypothetical protein
MSFTNNEDDSYNNMDVFLVDGNTTLIIRNSFLNSKGDSDKDWRRSIIFHSTCTVKDKVCSLIIDSESYENMVSVNAVRKL